MVKKSVAGITEDIESADGEINEVEKFPILF